MGNERQGGETMRKLGLAVLIVVALAGLAQAQTTAKLGLYADPNGNLDSCEMSIGIFGTDEIYLYYVKGNGPDLGLALEFMAELSTPDASFSPPPEWTSQIVLTIGDLSSGISLTAHTCLGQSQPYVYLGKISVFYEGFDLDTPFTARITQHPETGDITITACDANYTMYVVRGSWFVFNGPCNLGVSEKSWGAIKSLYR
jgi:hypothetical protein